MLGHLSNPGGLTFLKSDDFLKNCQVLPITMSGSGSTLQNSSSNRPECARFFLIFSLVPTRGPEQPLRCSYIIHTVFMILWYTYSRKNGFLLIGIYGNQAEIYFPPHFPRVGSSCHNIIWSWHHVILSSCHLVRDEGRRPVFTWGPRKTCVQ